MSTSAQGTISKKFFKEWTGQRGTITLCSFQLEGNRQFFRTGTTDLPFRETQTIKFTYDEVKGNVDLKSVVEVASTDVQAAPQIPSAAPAQSSAPAAAGKSKENWDARGKYWDEKERRGIEVIEPRITISSSQRDAITLVTAALANDALSFGSAAKGKKLDMILDFVDQVAARFYDQRMAGTVTSTAKVEQEFRESIAKVEQEDGATNVSDY